MVTSAAEPAIRDSASQPVATLADVVEKRPEELALEGFDADAGATVVNVEYKHYDDELKTFA
jgi:hypothetical protein